MSFAEAMGRNPNAIYDNPNFIPNQYLPRNQVTGTPHGVEAVAAPLIGSEGIHVGNEMYAWSYVVFTFIIFSVAFAVVRNLYRNVSNRKNIKKEFKKRIKRAIGDDLEGEQRDSFMGNQGGPEYNAPQLNNSNNDDEEEEKTGDGEGGAFKDGYLAGIKKGAKGAYKGVYMGAKGAYNKITGNSP